MKILIVFLCIVNCINTQLPSSQVDEFKKLVTKDSSGWKISKQKKDISKILYSKWEYIFGIKLKIAKFGCNIDENDIDTYKKNMSIIKYFEKQNYIYIAVRRGSRGGARNSIYITSKNLQDSVLYRMDFKSENRLIYYENFHNLINSETVFTEFYPPND